MSVNDKISMEYEARVMIDESTYEQIKIDYQNRNNNYCFIVNKNIYYDRDDFYLIFHEMMLRIREINGEAKEITLKVKGDRGDKEITRVISSPIDYSKSLLDLNLLNEEMLSIFSSKNVNPKDLHIITDLTTERMEIKLDDHLIVIDKNYYSDIIDYNIEIEADSRDNAKKYLLDICDKYNIKFSEHYLTKSKRAIKALLNNKK